MDVRFISPFVKSILNTFNTMCELPVTIAKPYVLGDDKNDADVSVVIGFSGDAAGTVIVKYSFEVASRIATAFAKIEIDQVHPDFVDALGELANMIAGGAKAQFEGLNVDISLPSVVVGSQHHFPASRNSQRIVLPCKTRLGTFESHVSMIVTNSSKGLQAATAGAAQ
ncbi:MAG: chemotaxis protein CheX [Planctomycetota bacterium]